MTTTTNPNIPPTPYTHADIAAAVARGLRNANDLPDPALDAGRSPLKYAALSENFRTGAWQHLDTGDLVQASNKVWGLVAETIKAVSAQHGGFIHKHRSIIEVLSQLSQLAEAAGDADAARQMVSAFATARDLHINFYEDEIPEYFVIKGLMECEEMSQRMYALFWPDGAPAPATA